MVYLKACKADWSNCQKLLRLESYKEQSLKRLNSFGGYITLPCRHLFMVILRVIKVLELFIQDAYLSLDIKPI